MYAKVTEFPWRQSTFLTANASERRASLDVCVLQWRKDAAGSLGLLPEDENRAKENGGKVRVGAGVIGGSRKEGN